MEKKYIYKGEIPIFISGIGRVNPGGVISTDKEIRHPLFFVYKEKAVKNSKKKV